MQCQITQDHHKAAAEFERVWGYKGVEGMLDMDYASSILSLDEETISDGSKERRRKVEARKGANMVRGKTWHTKKVRLQLNCIIALTPIGLHSTYGY